MLGLDVTDGLLITYSYCSTFRRTHNNYDDNWMLFSDSVNGGVHFVLPSAVPWVLKVWKPLRKSIFLSSNSTYPACV